LYSKLKEAIMAKTSAPVAAQQADLRRQGEAGNDRGCGALADGDELMDEILENLSTAPQDEVLRKIASLPRTRRDKVLAVRRQLTTGTYRVRDRLDWAVDRILEECVFVLDTGCHRRTSRGMTMIR
jgi:hypothetical protein